MGTPGLTSHSLFLSLSLHEVSQKRSLGNPSTRSLWTTWRAAQTSSLCLCLKHPHCPCLSPTGSLTARLGTRTQGGHTGSPWERILVGGCSWGMLQSGFSQYMAMQPWEELCAYINPIFLTCLSWYWYWLLLSSVASQGSCLYLQGSSHKIRVSLKRKPFHPIFRNKAPKWLFFPQQIHIIPHPETPC